MEKRRRSDSEPEDDKRKGEEDDRKKSKKHKRESDSDDSGSSSDSDSSDSGKDRKKHKDDKEKEKKKDKVEDREKKRERERKESSSDSSSDSESSDSERERKRRKKEKKEKKEKKDKKKEKRKEKKHKKDKKHKKEKKHKKDKDKPKYGYGHFGILDLSDMYRKQEEFYLWLQEVRNISPDTISQPNMKKIFADFMEDYNTCSMPHEKYYNLSKWEREQKTKKDRNDQFDVKVYNTINVLDDEERLKQERSQKKEKLKPLMSEHQIMELKRLEQERVELDRQRKLGLKPKSNLGIRYQETLL